MTIQLRTRLLLVAAVAVLGAATWLDVDAQRSRMLEGQAQVVGVADLQTAMVDQETGVRGFDQTGSDEFLEPYLRGRDAYERAIADARGRDAEREVRHQLAEMAGVAASWQALATQAVKEVRASARR